MSKDLKEQRAQEEHSRWMKGWSKGLNVGMGVFEEEQGGQSEWCIMSDGRFRGEERR